MGDKVHGLNDSEAFQGSGRDRQNKGGCENTLSAAVSFRIYRGSQRGFQTLGPLAPPPGFRV